MTTDPKEPTYFLTREQLLDVLPGVEKRGFWRGEGRYLKLFKTAEHFPIRGEASANYARLNRVTDVAERIARFNPAARIIVIMRDPVERTISHYWYMVRFFGERRGMLSAIKQDPDYTDTSHYVMQLRPYLERFGTGNVFTLTTEALRDEGERTMTALFRWLGVDDSFVPPELSERANEAPEIILQVRGRGLLHEFRHSGLWNQLSPLVPSSVRRLARRCSERPVTRQHADLAPVRDYLRGVQGPQVVELEDMLARRFPEWTTLHGEPR